MRTLKIEVRRVYRSHILLLSIALLILIAFLGIILNNIYYVSKGDSRFLLLSLYNSFTQFSYLILTYIFVSVFCKDFQNGVYIWYQQLGYSFKNVIISKFISLLSIILPVLTIIFVIAQIFSGNKDYKFFITSLICVNLNIIYIITLSFFLSVVFRKIIVTTLVMYGIYILGNGLNLWFYGIFNPADSNSIAAYYFAKLINTAQFHYSLGKTNLSDSILCAGSIIVPIMWSVLLVAAAICIKKYRKELGVAV